MCGFVTVFNPFHKPSINKNQVDKMCDLIITRGPDYYGYYEDDNLITGCRRLSILDLSDTANIPFSKNKYTISYNGEVYNYIEIRDKLIKDYNVKFITGSDTEVILEAFIIYGPKCLELFNGMFAFTIWDNNQKSLFIARDRLGVKPLFIAKINNDFYFASDIKSLWEIISPSNLLNSSAIYNYFGQGYISEIESTTKTINKFPSGHYQQIDKIKNITKEYWNIAFNNNYNKISFNETVEETERILEDAVKIRLRSDVPLGTFLSGGIDSTIITGITNKLISKDLNTFSIGFNEDQFDESKYANSVAKDLGTKHSLTKLDITALNDLPQIIWHYSELYSDSSSIPTFFVSKIASESLKVVLTGDGADEAYGGYLDPYVLYNSQKYNKLPNFIRQFFNFAFNNDKKYPNYLNKIKKFIKISNSDLLDAYMIFKDGNWSGYEDFLRNNKFSLKKSLSRYIDECESSDDINKLIYSDIKDRLCNDFLFKVDMGTMANSLEARSPFMDYRLIEFGLSMNHDIRYYNNRRKAVLKKIAEKYMDKKNINRRKMGFSIPKHLWLSDEKYWSIFKKIISRKSSLDYYVHRGKINVVLSEYEQGNHSHANRIWQLLVYQIWDGLFISKCLSQEQTIMDL